MQELVRQQLLPAKQRQLGCRPKAIPRRDSPAMPRDSMLQEPSLIPASPVQVLSLASPAQLSLASRVLPVVLANLSLASLEQAVVEDLELSLAMMAPLAELARLVSLAGPVLLASPVSLEPLGDQERLQSPANLACLLASPVLRVPQAMQVSSQAQCQAAPPA